MNKNNLLFKSAYNSIAKGLLTFVVFILVLSSCTEKKTFDANNIIGTPISSLQDIYGEPSSIDTINIWHIGDGNIVEFTDDVVYDFYLNANDPVIEDLNMRKKENRKNARKNIPSLLDVRLYMTKGDLLFLESEIDSVSSCLYYNYADGKRVQIINGEVTNTDYGFKSDVSVLDKLRLNLGEGNMMIINITLAFIMFGVALDMRVQGFKELLKNPKPLVVGFLSQFVLLPLVTFLLVFFMNLPPSIALGMILVAACPGGNVSNFISSISKANVELSVSLTAVATLSAVVLTPFNYSFWGNLYASTSNFVMPITIDLWQMTKIVVLLLGLPIILGMLVRYYYPKVADKITKPMKWFSLLFFIGLVVGAIMQNLLYFKMFAWLVAGIVILHNFIAFLTGFSLASFLKVDSRDRRTVTIETGIQNSGLALVLIVNPNLFDGLGGMAFIAAVWGIWHIVSGMILASIWRLKK